MGKTPKRATKASAVPPRAKKARGDRDRDDGDGDCGGGGGDGGGGGADGPSGALSAVIADVVGAYVGPFFAVTSSHGSLMDGCCGGSGQCKLRVHEAAAHGVFSSFDKAAAALRAVIAHTGG